MADVEAERIRITNSIVASAVAKCENVDLDQVKIDHYQIDAGSNKGDGFACIILSIEVNARVKGMKKELHFITKTVPVVGGRADILKEADIFETEIIAYEVAYKLNDIRKYYGLELIPFPKCYYMSANEDIMVMEDLKKSGFGLVPKTVEGLALDATKLVLKSLAQLHATGYHYLNKYPGGINGFNKDYPLLKSKPFFRVENNEKMNENLKEMEKNTFRTATKIVEIYGDQELGLKMCEFEKKREKVLDDAQKVQGNFHVINHGDAWYNNMMFAFKPDGSVDKMVFLDLQMMKVGRPALDLVYFLCSSTSPECRQEHLNDLLRYYYDELIKNVTKLGHLANVYCYEEFVQDIDRSFALGFVFGCLHAQVLVMKSDDVGDMDFGNVGDEEGMKTMMKKMEASAVKLAANNPDYTKRLIGLAKEAARRGFI